MLIASAPTEDRLLTIAKRYWCSPNIMFEDGKAFNSKGQIKGFAVLHTCKGRVCLVTCDEEEDRCDICGDVHEGEVPRECETGDGV